MTVKGTHSIHQVLTTNSEVFFYRDVSCFCMENEWTLGKFCKCFQSFKKIVLKEGVKQKRSPIYSTDDDDTSMSSIDLDSPGVSGCESKLQPGAYVLIKVFRDKPNKAQYRYVGVCQEYDAVDGELKVAFFRVTGENGQLFRLMEEDISYVEFDQIISILPNPQLVMKGNRVYYRFPFPIDVFEKA